MGSEHDVVALSIEAGSNSQEGETRRCQESKLATALAVAFFAIWGCLLRESLTLMTATFNFTCSVSTTTQITAVEPEHSSSAVWIDLGATYFVPNCLGCFLMGITFGVKPSAPPRWAVTLGGFGTGFCGSLTTFSTWMGDAGAALVAGHWLKWVNLLVINFMVYLAFWELGCECAQGTSQCAPPSRTNDEVENSDGQPDDEALVELGRADEELNALSSRQVAQAGNFRNSLGYGIAFSITECGAIVLAMFQPHNRAMWVSVAFAPLGALLRWGLGTYNKLHANGANWSGDHFPLFTCIANVGGTLIRVLLAVGCWTIAGTTSCAGSSALHQVRFADAHACDGAIDVVALPT